MAGCSIVRRGFAASSSKGKDKHLFFPIDLVASLKELHHVFHQAFARIHNQMRIVLMPFGSAFPTANAPQLEL